MKLLNSAMGALFLSMFAGSVAIAQSAGGDGDGLSLSDFGIEIVNMEPLIADEMTRKTYTIPANTVGLIPLDYDPTGRDAWVTVGVSWPQEGDELVLSVKDAESEFDLLDGGLAWTTSSAGNFTTFGFKLNDLIGGELEFALQNLMNQSFEVTLSELSVDEDPEAGLATRVADLSAYEGPETIFPLTNDDYDTTSFYDHLDAGRENVYLIYSPSRALGSPITHHISTSYSCSFDTVIEVYNLQYEMIASNDDEEFGDGSLCSSLYFSAQTGYKFYVVVRGYDEFEEGEYLLDYFAIPGSLDTTEDGDPAADAIDLVDGTGMGSIDEPYESQWFRFATADGQRLRAYTTGETDTVMEVYSASMFQLVSDDDSGEMMNASATFMATSDTIYIKVSAYSDSTGGFELVVADLPELTVFDVGEPAEAMIVNEVDTHYYSILLGEACYEFVTICDVDTVVRVSDMEGKEIAMNDDDPLDGSTTCSRVQAMIPVSGVYMVEVHSYDYSRTGSYELHALQSECSY